MQFFEAGDLGEVALVVLHDQGQPLVEVEVILGEVQLEVVERLEVGFEAGLLGVGDEDDGVGALEDQLAAGVVEDLPGTV